MIIDCHTHIGSMLQFELKLETLLESMEKYGIDFSLVSSIEGAEFDHERNPIPQESQIDQSTYNKALLANVRANKRKLGALIWVKPHNEKINHDFETLIKDNLDIIYGIKFHPYHSQLPFDDERSLAYVELAGKYKLPVVIHTASSYESSPELVYKVAKKYPEIDFVMYHLGLGTDNKEAIELISALPNLYGDTSWVLPDKTIKAIDLLGPDKIMFGTDNPIDGLDTLGSDVFYHPYLKDFSKVLDSKTYEKLMSKNAIKLFKIGSGVHK